MRKYRVLHTVAWQAAICVVVLSIWQWGYDLHAKLPHTVSFIEKVEGLIDHPLDVNRTHALD